MKGAFGDKVFNFTKERALFSAPCHLLLGVSGGADSMSMLHSLYRWPIDGLRLTVLHIHHGLRADTADRDATFVQNYCAKLGISCIVEHLDVSGYAAENGMSVEEAGRCLRYDAFERVRQEVGADYILTAHTADDQAETVLMRILRGCGTDGLVGIPVARGVIRRPLLCCTRMEVEQYCAQNNVQYIVDETNEDTVFARNRIRHEILPYLREVNPSVNAALLRLSQHATEDAALLKNWAIEALAEARRQDGWSVETFLDRPMPIRRRMISVLLRDAAVPTIEESHIIAVDRVMQSGNGKVHLPNATTIAVGQGMVRLLSTADEKTAPDALAIGSLPLSAEFGGVHFTLSVHNADKNINVHNLFLNAALDYDTMQGKLYVRCRREGDYMHPSGRHIGKSIKKLMNEWKIPEHLRDTLPMVCDDLGVVLVPGYACDERVKPTADTKHFLVWHTDEVKA